MVDIEQFFDLVNRYAKAKDISEATVSIQLFNDGKRMRVLRGGGDVGVRKVERAVRQLSDNWPEGKVAWPREVRRPRRELTG